MQADATKVHFALQFTRYDAQDRAQQSYQALYVVTLQDGHWGVQSRSSYAGVLTPARPSKTGARPCPSQLPDTPQLAAQRAGRRVRLHRGRPGPAAGRTSCRGPRHNGLPQPPPQSGSALPGRRRDRYDGPRVTDALAQRWASR